MLDQDWPPNETQPGPLPGLGDDRLYRTDLEALAEQLAAGRRLEQGCVMMIGLDAIRDRLGERWARRREQVWEAVDRLLERRLAPNALHARVGELNYLIEAGTTPDQAQAVAFKLLQELHLFFLGDRRLDAMRIESVVSFDGRNLLSRPLESLPIHLAEETPSFAAPDTLPLPRGQWSTLSFVPAGHCLQVAFERQGVVQLSSGKVTATRLRPVILRDHVARAGTEATEGLSHAELLAVDQATMTEALSAGEGPLVAPFFFETLSNTRGRATLLEALGGRATPRGLMIELIGVDGGTPHSRLLETVSLLAPYCGGVIVQAPPGRPCAAVIGGVRLSGLSVDCEDAPRAAMTAAARLADCKAQKGVGPLLFAFGLPTLTSLPLAHKAGATHASLATQIAAV